jgi:hypothetical protein
MSDVLLSLVAATTPLSDDAALSWLQTRARVKTTISGLARQWGWHRSMVRRRIEKWEESGIITRVVQVNGKSIITVVTTQVPSTSTELASNPLLCAELAARATTSVRSIAEAGDPRQASPTYVRPKILADAVFLLGLVAAAVGLCLNAWFLWSLGQTSPAGLIFAAIGLVIDGATLILPPVVIGLLSRRRRWLSVLAAMLYAVVVVMTLLVAIGFAATNIGDSISARAAIVSERTSIGEVIERVRAERGRLPPFTPTTVQGVATAQPTTGVTCRFLAPVWTTLSDVGH